MLRTNLARALGFVVLLAGIATGGVLAADNSITISPSTVPVQANGYNYRFAVDVTCGESADAAACNGLLSIKTFPIKPYSSTAKKTWVVGALPFVIPAGTTAPVHGRLLAGALVQLKKAGRLRVQVSIVRDEEIVGTRALLLKLKKG
jgi:hypothetical protein